MEFDKSGDADLLLTNGTIVTVDPDRRVLDNSTVAVSKGRILKIGPAAELKAQYKSAPILDCTGKAILPGLIDTHGYLGWSIMKSLGEGLDEVKIRDLYERILSQLTDEEWWLTEAQMCALDRVKFGTTFMFSMMGGNGTRTDDPVFTRIAAQGLSQVGVRARIGIGPARPPWPRVYSRWNSDGSKTDEEVSFDKVIDNCDTLLGEPPHPSGLIEYCTALSRFGNRNPHDPVWSQDREQWVFRQAGSHPPFDGEAQRSILDARLWQCGRVRIRRETGPTRPDDDPVALHRSSPAGDRNHERDQNQRRTSAAHIPHDQARLPGSGNDRCRHRRWPGFGYTFNNASDLFLDMRAAMLLQRVRFRDRRVLPPGKALEMATIDGARALGLDKEIGSIEVGKKADMITIDLRQPHLYPPDMIPMRLVTNGSGKDVNDVIIDGRIVMRDRIMTTVDESAVLDQAVAMYHRTIERGSLQQAAKIHEPLLGRFNVLVFSTTLRSISADPAGGAGRIMFAS